MGILGFISGLFKPATDIVNSLDIPGNKKRELQNALAEIQAKANEKLIDLEMAAIEGQTRRIEAEAKSENFLQANWRPASSLALIIAIIAASYGIGDPGDQLYHLAELVIGINMSSRGLEKVAKVGGLGAIVKGLK